MPPRTEPSPPRSPVGLLATGLLVIFAVELSLDAALPRVMPHASPLARTALDAAILTVLAGLLTWRFLVRPLRAAEEERAMSAHVMAHAGDAIITIDEQGVIRFANDASARVFGHPVETLVGADVSVLMPSPEREMHEDHIARYLQTGEKRALDRRREVTGLRADGTTFPVELSVSEVRVGSRRYFTAVIRDVTERRAAEQALRESEERYRRLFDGNPTPLFLYDPATLRFLAVNDAALRQYGYTREEFLEMRITQLRPEGDIPELMHHLASPAVNGIRRAMFRHRRKDGSILQVDAISHAMDARGEGPRLVIATDVSERATLERQLRQAQKMEAVGQLAGGMAHDFNNLLSTILTTAELMADELSPDSPLTTDLDTIRLAAGHGATLTAKLLAFSRRKPLEYQTLGLDELLGEFGRVVRRLVPESIELTLSLDAGGARIRADSGAVEQIVMNLVTNARDAMPAGGRLRIATERTVLDEAFCLTHAGTTPADHVILSVTDTGAGMDTETLLRVFEPFFTTKPVGVGTGLGMAMVYGLVKQHQGYVDVSSRPGVGTTVSVYLPVDVTDRPAPVTEAPQASGGAGETILLVEDEPALRAAATRVLRKSGYEVVVASDGREALERLAGDCRVDLIITDVVMPRLGGNELIKELRDRGQYIRVLFTSGYPGRGDVPETMEPGFPFLTKPWTIPELLAAVRGALEAPLPGATSGSKT